MRVLPLLLVALLLVPMVPAQSMTITAAHQVRIAYGDIPATDERTETDGRWNVEQLLILAEGENATATIPPGHTLQAIHCGEGCDFDAELSEGGITITCLTPTDDGVCSVSVPHSAPGTLDAFGLSMRVDDNNTVFVYTPEGLAITSGTENLLDEGFFFPGTNLIIHQFTAENGRFWFTASPASTIVEEPSTGGFSWISALIGLAVGIALWYILVSQGIVQKRQRKQVAGMAAHKAAAGTEPKATLEWRRRALLAALKELEVARMDQTIDLDAYDILKADFKKQTVTVMRALEELGE